MASQDPAERVAQELAEWLELRSTQVANAILESVYRPRVVEPTTAETVAYFRPLLVNPDNTLNEQGKAKVISQYGATGYEDIARAVAKSIRAEQDEAPAPGSQVDRFGPGVPTLQGSGPTTAQAPMGGY